MTLMRLAHLVVLCTFFVAMFAGGCATVDLRTSEDTCQVHHLEMATKTVPFHYGLVRYPEGYDDARARLFPNANDWLCGGCLPHNGAPKQAIVRSCSDCEKAKLAWNQAAQARAEAASTLPPPPAPTEIDLRPRLTALGLTPRPQGPRGTCSIFTTCEALEFALAMHTGHARRLSPEFLNWAASQAAGRPSDGNFFHNAINGFERFGICTEEQMPYQPAFDAARQPSDSARAEGRKILEDSRISTPAGPVTIHWIVPWQTAKFGVADAEFAEIKRVIASGYPVAAGSGHSRLLVGYRDDAAAPGGGKFMTEDSALNRFDEVTYEFVRKQVADVFWVEAVGQPATPPVAAQ